MASLAVRRLGAELLDDPRTDSGLVARIAPAHRPIQSVVRGDRCALLVEAGGTGTGPDARLTLLDLGSGLGNLPRAAVRWAAHRGPRRLVR